jgi:serine/threonine protein kinase
MCDFGFARLNEKRGARAMTLCGTDDWMAPEVILGMEYDAKADVFSFGIVMLEIITREKVSSALQRSAVHGFELDVSKARLLLPVDCPTGFSDLAFECCKYKPEDRPSFKEVVKRLSDDIKTFPAASRPAQSQNRGGPNMRMRGMRGRGGAPPPRGGAPGSPGATRGGAPSGSPRGAPAPRPAA